MSKDIGFKHGRHHYLKEHRKLLTGLGLAGIPAIAYMLSKKEDGGPMREEDVINAKNGSLFDRDIGNSREDRSKNMQALRAAGLVALLGGMGYAAAKEDGGPMDEDEELSDEEKAKRIALMNSMKPTLNEGIGMTAADGRLFSTPDWVNKLKQKLSSDSSGNWFDDVLPDWMTNKNVRKLQKQGRDRHGREDGGLIHAKNGAFDDIKDYEMSGKEKALYGLMIAGLAGLGVSQTLKADGGPMKKHDKDCTCSDCRNKSRFTSLNNKK